MKDDRHAHRSDDDMTCDKCFEAATAQQVKDSRSLYMMCKHFCPLHKNDDAEADK